MKHKEIFYDTDFYDCDIHIKKSMSRIWIKFVIAVFFIMLSASVILGLMVYILLETNHFSINERQPFFTIIAMLLTSTILGTLISIIAGRKILVPLNQLINAEKEVAGGNFNISLSENHYIEEYREMSRNFNIMVQELSGIETLRNDFVLNVSHEFKTPIAAIEGYAFLLQDENLSLEERREYTRFIIDATHQLSSLTGNILRISKLENQEIITEKKPFSLDEQIRQAILMLESGWSEKNIEFNPELAQVIITSSEELLMQVWTNLIGNAIKFSPADSVISVTLHIDSDTNESVVCVSDNGIGMSQKTQKHIFEKFYQEDKARYSGGNGLGLALVKRICTLCGGSISLTSELGKGSSFYVRIPM